MKIPQLLFKAKRACIIAAGFLGVYAVAGFYVLPVLLKPKLPDIIQQQTGRKTSVSKIRFNPFSLSASLQGFEIQEQSGQPFAAFDNLYINVGALQSIIHAALVIEDLSLQKPFVHIARQKDGAFNFQDLLKDKGDAKENDGNIFPVTIERLSIAEGKLAWEDNRFDKPEKEEAYPVNFSAENFTMAADKQFQITASLALSSGGQLDWQGAVGINPLSSSGHIKLDNVQLQRILALGLQSAVPVELQGYELLEADYKLAYADNGLDFIVSQGNLGLRDVQVSEKNQKKLLAKMPAIALHGVGFNLKSRELVIESAAADNADFQTWLNADGVINYQALFPVSKTEGTVAEPGTASWNIKVNDIALNNAGFKFEDQTMEKPGVVSLKPINFKLANFSNKAGATLPFQLSAGVNEAGVIKLNGDTVISPFSSSIAVDAKDIALEKLQPFVDKFARLDVIDGRLNIDGNISVAEQKQDKLDVKFKGKTGIAGLLTRDRLKNKDFVKWENLTLEGVELDLLANQYNAETLLIDKPYARVVIRKDKTVNFGDIMIADKSKPAAAVRVAKTAQTDAQKPKFKLGKIQVIDGSSDFSDLSLILPFAAQIKSLNGGASGISAEQKSTVKVALKGTAYDLSPVDVKGEISPYLGNYDVSVNFTGMPMPLVSPYMVQFAGYKVEKGKMSLGLNYKVANRELTASNSILIDQFELGEKVENPNAVSLPLGLAVALIKDSDGKIKIDVPITGSLEDPKFSVSHLIVDALVNAISKVVTSPFRALASLIGSEQDLSTISFAAGDAVLTRQQISKLDDLAKALKTRSVLKLEIKGAAFQEQDWPAVSDDALYDQLKRIKADEVNKQGGRKIRPEYVVISDQDYRRLMEQLFVEKFPLMVEKSLLGTTRLVGSKADTNTDEFYAVAKEKLSAIIKPEEQRLKGLAAERAQAIANYIVKKGGIANERVFILDTAIDPAREGDGIVSLLSLKAD